MLDEIQEKILRELLLTQKEMTLELKLLRQDVRDIVQTISSVTMELIDPSLLHDEQDQLPEFLPARDALVKAGITRLEDVPRTSKSLRAIDGIGWDEATMILGSLGDKEK